jgi:hypothetical protein
MRRTEPYLSEMMKTIPESHFKLPSMEYSPISHEESYQHDDAHIRSRAVP